MPKFSVILPIYNVEPYIEQALQSLQNQTFTDFEALCVDDCGTDNSMKIVEKFAQNDSRFKIISYGENKGTSYARNIAMKKMQGDYLLFLDPDDFISPEALKKILEKFKKTNTESVWFDFFIFEQNKGIKGIKSAIYGNDEVYNLTPENLAECPFYIWNKAYKISKIKELNAEFPLGLFYQDTEFCFKVFTNITTIAYINEPLYCYRVRSGSTVTSTQSGDLKRINDFFVIINNLYNYAKEKNIYNDYKLFFLKMLTQYLNWLRNDVQKEVVIKNADELIKLLNFPEGFKEFENKTFSNN